jgi:hypothetical protein
MNIHATGEALGEAVPTRKLIALYAALCDALEDVPAGSSGTAREALEAWAEVTFQGLRMARRESRPPTPFVSLGDLRPGAVFETPSGVRAVKTEYRTFDGGRQCDCYLLASGEAAHFPDGDRQTVREVPLEESAR